jgi:hypothetical protein
MSNVTGAVRFTGGLILFYEYGGTCDVCNTALWETPSFGYPDNDNYEDGEPDWSPFIKWREESEAEHRARPARPKGLSGNSKDRRQQRRLLARKAGLTNKDVMEIPGMGLVVTRSGLSKLVKRIHGTAQS